MREQRGEDVSSLEALCKRLCNKRVADTAFLVQVLHLVNDQDEIFARDYVYVRAQPPKPQISVPLLDNADGFYSGLPPLK